MVDSHARGNGRTVPDDGISDRRSCRALAVLGADGLGPEWLRCEVAEHRRRHTFGGMLWFPDDDPEPPATAVKQKKLTGPEILEEAEWLLGGQMHPLMIQQQLGVKALAIYRASVRYGNDVVRAAFARYSTPNGMRVAS